MRFLIYRECFLPSFCTLSSYFVTVLNTGLNNNPFTLEFRMCERFENDQRRINVLWTVTERTVSERWMLCERWTRANVERWTQNCEQWANGERSISARCQTLGCEVLVDASCRLGCDVLVHTWVWGTCTYKSDNFLCCD